VSYSSKELANETLLNRAVETDVPQAARGSRRTLNVRFNPNQGLLFAALRPEWVDSTISIR
jgi:hypothetical protein